MSERTSLDKALSCSWSNISYWVQNPAMEQPQNITQPPSVMQQQLNNPPAGPKLQEHKWKISKCEGTSVMRVKCSPGEQTQFCIISMITC